MKLGLSTKISILLVTVAIVAVGLIGLTSYNTGHDVLEKELFEKLTAVREMKADQIEDQFNLIKNQILTFSEDRMVIDAMISLRDGFNNIKNELSLPESELKEIIKHNKNYFENEFKPRIVTQYKDEKYFPISNLSLENSKKEWLFLNGLLDEKKLTSKPIHLPPVIPSRLLGEIVIDGSSTAFGLIERLVDRFKYDGLKANVLIKKSGTSSGLKELSEGGDIDLVTASRKMSSNEYNNCKKNDITPVEFTIANDALVLVVNAKNDFLNNLTIEELAKIFSKAQKWIDINPAWPDKNITRIVPTLNSGSFNFFRENILDANNVVLDTSKQIQIAMDGKQFKEGISNDIYSIGFLSHSYYSENDDSYRVIKVNGYSPTFENIQNNVYPILRPLYIYSTEQIIKEKAQVSGFINYLLTTISKEVGSFTSSDDYWESDIETQIIQNLYITNNTYEVGSKDLLLDAEDGSSYSRMHRIYHPIIRDYLKKFNYYDIFLVDNKTGHIVYSVYKETDYGTNLFSGPYSKTNFADSFNDALNNPRPGYTKIVDFEPYLPSYNAPAAFISSPILDNEDLIGVLIFQMPIESINDIMTSKNDWSSVGLGQTGETYIVGNDYLLRNQSRFLIEDRENYFQMLREIDFSSELINKIQIYNSTIGLQPVKTIGVEAALKGQTGTQIFADYRGISVLSSYKPLEISDLNWVIMSEMDEDEAFESIYSLRNNILIWLGGIIVFIVILGVMFAKTITHPIKKLTRDAEELAKGNLDVEIPIERKDEIGNLAVNFDTMRKSIKNLITELEEANKNLEQKVIDRTKGLQQANERIKSILDNAPFAMITIDEKKEIVVFNPTAERTFGYKANEVIGKHLNILIPEKSRSIHDDLVDQFAKEKTISRPLDTRRPLGGRKKDGTIFPLEAGISKLKLSSKMFYTAFAIDITKRKAAEEELIRQSTALESAANGIVITDTEGLILWVNPAFTKLTGYKYQEAVGQNPRVLNSGKHEKDFFKEMWDTINSGKVWLGEVINKRKDGSYYTEEMTITPVKNEEGELINFVAIKQDITERKELERKLEEANKRMKGELDIGREIQMSMLPLIFPAFPDHNEFSIHAEISPAREVGGDYYDFFFISDSHFCFSIGDVSGKGVPSALFMAVTKTLIKSRATVDFSTASIITHVNDELSEDNITNMFVTDFIAILNIHTGELTYTNAGHNPPMIKKSNGTVEKLGKRHGPVIGAMPGMTYEEDKIFLDKNDKIVLYTDGVTEAMDKSNNLYSESRLVEFLSKNTFDSNDYLVYKIIEDVKKFENGAEQADDITILSLNFKGSVKGYENKFLEIKLVNKLTEITRLNKSFNEFAQNNNIDKSISGKINIVFDELLNNTISYAYPDDLEHYIEVKIDLPSDRLTISIIDDGIPFNPFQFKSPDTSLALEDREIGGLGIHLVKSFMDKVTYNRGINKNIITLVKNLKI